MKNSLCLALACLVMTVAAGPCDLANEDDRTNCGESLDKDKCEDQNCCYDSDAVNGKARCFHPSNACDMPGQVCKYGAECKSLDAFDKNGVQVFDGQYKCSCPRGYPSGSNCRVKQGACGTDVIPPTERMDCGKVGHFANAAKACNNRGCCYNKKIRGVNWCFHPSPDCPIMTMAP